MFNVTAHEERKQGGKEEENIISTHADVSVRKFRVKMGRKKSSQKFALEGVFFQVGGFFCPMLLRGC